MYEFSTPAISRQFLSWSRWLDDSRSSPDDRSMAMGAATTRVYDHRVRELVCATGDPNLFPKLAIPRSTSAGWLREGGVLSASVRGVDFVADLIGENAVRDRVVICARVLVAPVAHGGGKARVAHGGGEAP